MNLSLVLGHSKKYVVVRDHSGACCGDSRPEYVGELGIGIIGIWIVVRIPNNPNYKGLIPDSNFFSFPN